MRLDLRPFAWIWISVIVLDNLISGRLDARATTEAICKVLTIPV